MTDEDQTPGLELVLAPVVALQLLASPVGHLTGGEQGGQRWPANSGSVLSIIVKLGLLILSTCLLVAGPSKEPHSYY